MNKKINSSNLISKRERFIKSDSGDKNFVFEELEPRLLLSADGLGVITASSVDTFQGLINDENHQTFILQEFSESASASLTVDVNKNTSPSAARTELVIIDSRAPNFQQLHNDVLKAQQQGRDINVVILDAHRDGIQQISEAISKYNKLDAIHIVSHGKDAQLELGATQLNKQTLKQRSEEISQWQDVFTERGDVLIYGCNLAETSDGTDLVNSLSKITGADVAASDDLTGNSILGGDWDLEFKTGDIETSLAFSTDVQENWQSTLDANAQASGEEQQDQIQQEEQQAEQDAELEAALLAEEEQTEIAGQELDQVENLQASTIDEQRLEIVFIDQAVDDYQSFIDDLNNNNNGTINFEIVLLDDNHNGVEQISETLSTFSDVDAVHIFSHGTDGSVKLGNTWLNANNIDDYGSSINSWGNSLDDSADILIYGCNLASSESGEQFINTISALTNAEVAASDDLTGYAELGGDWDLEYNSGTIETDVAVSADLQASYEAVLAPPVAHWTFDTDATDSSGNNYHGTLTNDAAIDTAAATNLVGGGKLSLDGTDDRVDLSAHIPSLGALAEGSISAWFNTTDAGFNPIFSVTDSNSTNDYAYLEMQSGRLLFEVVSGGVIQYTAQYGTQLNDGNWHHVSITADSGGNHFYVDGVEILAGGGITYWSGSAANTQFFADVNNADTISIGAFAVLANTTGRYTGLLDEVQIHDYALTSGEVALIAAVNDAPTFVVGDGVVNTPIGASNDVGRGIMAQPDGKLIVSGYFLNGPDYDFFLTRYNQDGTLDSSFGGGDGIVMTAISATSDFANAVAIQSDGKIVVTGESHNGGDYDFLVTRYNSDGTLDATFGIGGVVTTDFGANTNNSNTVAIQDDGKIVIGGKSYNGTNFDITLVRYNANGSLDTSFDGDGIVVTSIGASSDIANEIAIQSDGKLVVFGQTWNGISLDMAVLRYNTDGSLDTSFDGDGIVTTVIGANSDYALSGSLQADGKIVAVGTSNNGADEFAIVRYNSDGSLDTSFDGDGKTTVAIGNSDIATAVSVRPDGKIVVSGYTYTGTQYDIAVIQLNSNGSLDTSFDGDGIVTTDLGDAFAYDHVLLSDGSIAVTGTATNGATNDIALIKYSANGSLDNSVDAINTLDGNPTFIEDGSAVVLDADVQVFDKELFDIDNFSGASLTLARNGGSNTEDVFTAKVAGTLGALTEAGNLVVGGTTVGTVTTNSVGTLVLSFNANATNALVNSAMQQIAYSNSSDTPPATTQINWTFSDGNSGAQGTGGALEANGSTTVSINSVNDAPVNNVPGAQAVNEDTVLVFNSTNGNLISITDVDAGSSDLLVYLSVNDGILTLSGTTGITFAFGTSNGTAGMTFSGTLSNINNALDGLTFTPDANFNGSVTLQMTTYDDVALLGSYQFDLSGDTGLDYSPSGSNDGVVNGAAPPAIPDASPRDNTLEFDGSADDHVQINGRFGDPTDVTLAAWVNLTSYGINGADVISLGDDVTLRMGNWSGGSLRGSYFDSATSTWQETTFTVDLENDGWHHIAYTIDDASNTQKIYLDGVEVGSNTTTGSILYGTHGANSYIGIHGDAAVEWDFTGQIDDARVYGRALTGQEILSLANNTSVNSDGDTVSITVNSVNDAPTTGDAGSGVLEDPTYALINLNGSDIDGTVTHFRLNNLPANGILYLDSGLTTVVAAGVDYVKSGALLPMYFVPDANWNGITTFDYVAKDDQGAYSAVAGTATINVTAVNDDPVIAFGEGNKSYTENNSPIIIDALATVSDVDLVDFNGGVLDVRVIANGSGSDRIEIRNEGMSALQVGMTTGPNEVYYSGVLIGTWAGSGAPLAITFNATADVVAVEAVMRNITFQNLSDTPSTLTRTMQFSLTDGDGGTSTSITKDLNVIAVNDAPTATNLNAAESFTEDTALNLTDIVVSDIDSANATVTLTLSDVSAGTLSTATSGAVTSTFVGGVWTASGAIANVNILLAGVIFNPTLNYESNFSIATSVDDGAAPAITGTKVITAIPVNDAPVSSNGAAYTAPDSTYTFSISDFNFSDVDTADSLQQIRIAGIAGSGALTLSGASVSNNDVVSVADITAGNLKFTPAVGESGTNYASFNFEVHDGTTYAAASSSMTINVSGLTPSYFQRVQGGGIVVDSAGMRLGGEFSGGTHNPTLTVSGIPVGATVIDAFLYINELDFGAVDTGFTLSGNAVVMTEIGSSADPSWGANRAVTLKADVSAIVTGNGSYILGGVGPIDAYEGAVLVVVYENLSATSDSLITLHDGSITLRDLDNINLPLSFNSGSVLPAAHTSASTTIVTFDGQDSYGENGVSFQATSAGSATNIIPINSFDSADGGSEQFTIDITAYISQADSGATLFQQSAASNDYLVYPFVGTVIELQNAAPVANDVSTSGNEDAASVAISLTATDSDGSVDNFRLNGLPANGTLYLDAGLSVVATTGTDYAATTESLTLYFEPNLNWNGNTTFDFVAKDNHGLLSASAATATITVNPVNDAPTATNLSAAESYTEDTLLNLTNIVVNDVDSANTTVTLTLSDVGAGALSTATSGVVTSTFVGGVWTASGAISNVNILLAGVTFNPTLNYDSNFSIATSVDDGVAPPVTGSKAFTAAAVNDAPTATNLNAAETYTEDSILNLIDIVVSDIDSANTTVTLTLSDIGAGALSTATSGAVTSTFVGGVWTASGAIADVNILLAGVSFNPAANYNSDFTIATSVDDGVAAPVTGLKIITATAVNDAPVGTNGSVTAFEDTPYQFTVANFGFTDVIDSHSLLAVEISTLTNALAGTLTLTGSGNVTIGQVITVADIVAGNLVFTATNADANGTNFASFNFRVQDNGGVVNGGSDIDATQKTLQINVSAVNDAPAVTVPGSQTVTEFTNLTFSAANTNALSVFDLEAGTVEVTLTATNGLLSLSGITGLAFNTGTGAGDAVMTFSGSQLDVNNALEGLTFISTVNHFGAGSVQLDISDLGSTGIGGVLTDSQTVAITINAVTGGPPTGDAFLQGDYIEVGISGDGAFGSNDVAPAGYVQSGSQLGIIGDRDKDGWATYDGDYVLAGTFEEGWGVHVGGADFNNNNILASEITGSLSNFVDTGTSQSVDWNGNVSGLDIDATYSIDKSGQFVEVYVYLTNTTGGALNDVYYMRNVDPDNNSNQGSVDGFNTTNTIISQGNDGSSIARVEATQADGSYLGLVGFGDNARVTQGGFSNRSAQDVYNGTGGLSQTGTNTADQAISLAFNYATISAGETVALRYQYIIATPTGPGVDLDLDGNAGALGAGYQTTFTEGGAAVTIADSDAIVFDPDSANLTSMTVALISNPDGALEVLLADVSGTLITQVYNSATGTLTLSGSDTVANYQQVLRTITYNNTSSNPDAADRVIQVTVNDGVNTSNIATSTITIASVNDAPTATNLSAAETYTEDTTLNLTDIVVSDVDSANTTVILTLSDVAAGSLSTATSGSVTSTFVGGVWTASGAIADVNILLAGLTFNPALNYNTNFNIVTSVDDGVAPAVTGSKFFTAIAVNDAPTATNLNAAETYTEDTVLNLIDIVVSDIDSVNTTVTLTLSDIGAGSLSTATSGAVTSTFVGGVWAANGAIADVNILLAGLTFNPTLNYNTNFNIVTSVDDGIASAVTGSKSFTAIAVNDAPTATNLSAAESYTEDTPLNLTDIVVTDIDSVNTTVTLTLSDIGAGSLSTATSGAVTSTFVGGVWTASGAIVDVNVLLAGLTFNPTLNYNTNFSIATSVDDGIATAITGTKIFTATPVNDPAIIGGVDTGLVTEDVDPDLDTLLETSGALTISDVDVGEASFIAGTLVGTYGDISIDAAGNWSYAADNTQAVIQNLAAGASLIDTISITSFDGTTHNIVITINGSNDAAVIGGVDTGAVTEDVDPDLDTLLETNGALTITDTDTGEATFTAGTIIGTFGDVTIDAAGNWSYAADNTQAAIQNLAAGASLIDTISITSFDGTTHNIVITINGANDAAVIGGVDTGAVTEDVDPDLDTLLETTGALTITDTDTGEASFTAGTLVGTFGDITIDAAGNWSYAADNTQAVIQNLAAGATLIDTISITSFDGTMHNIVITINGSNDAAVIGGVDTGVVTEDVDPDLDTLLETTGALTIIDTDTGEASFTAGTLVGTFGDITIDAAGNWSYAADNTQAAIQNLAAGASLIDTISITSFDGTTHNIVITINGSNDAAVIGGVDTGAVTEDIDPDLDTLLETAGALTISDIDTGEASFTAGTIVGTFGDITIDAVGNWSYAADNTQAAIQNLAAGATLIDTISITSFDGTTHNIVITINGANDAAVIGGVDTGAVTEDVDPDLDTLLETAGALTITDTDTGEASFTAGTLAGTYGALVIDAAGNWNYSADNTQLAIQSLTTGDSLIESISITSFDGTTHNIVITISGANDAPVAQNDSSPGIPTINEGGTAILDLSANDSDIDNAIDLSSIVITIPPLNGSLIINGDGTVTYTHDGSETISDSFSYTIADISGAVSNIATASLIINPVNDAPVAQNDNALTVDEGATANFDLAANDSDADDGLDLNSINIISAPINGSLVVNSNGTVTYTHDSSETLTDSFTYTIADVSGVISNVATANIVINPVNDAPMTVGISNVTVLEDASNTNIDLNAAFSDSDNTDSELTYSIVSNTNNGLFSSTTINLATGQLSLDYAADNNGSSQITVRAIDPSGASVDTLFTVNVTPVNDDSVVDVNNGALVTDVSEKIIDTSMLNSFDIDNTLSEITYTITNLPDNGVLLLNGVVLATNDSFTQADLVNGNVSYQLGFAPSGNDQFGFTVSDGSSTLSAMTFDITISLTPVDPGDPGDPGFPEPEEPVDPDEVDPIKSVDLPDAGDPSSVTHGTTVLDQLLQSLTSGVEILKSTEINETRNSDLIGNMDVANYNLKSASSLEDIQIKSIKALWMALDKMQEQINEHITENMTDAELKAAVVSSSGVALTAGVVAWVLRSGALMTSLISTIPLWKGYDPMPILAKQDEDDEDDDLLKEKVPTSLDEMKKQKELKEKMKTYNQVDSMFGGLEARE